MAHPSIHSILSCLLFLFGRTNILQSKSDYMLNGLSYGMFLYVENIWGDILEIMLAIDQPRSTFIVIPITSVINASVILFLP